MNRHERDAAENEDPYIVAVREAGHAVAKVVAARELGYGIIEAIDRIEIGTGDGLFWSKAVKLGLAGADIGKWFRARAFVAVSGSMAEAIFSSREFIEVWCSSQAESDLLSLVSDAHWTGVVDEVQTTTNRMAVLSACVMERPEVWAAVISLANTLSAVGMIDGANAAAVIAGVIPEADLTHIFDEGLRRVAEWEREISTVKVAVGIHPDGSEEIIKGYELWEKMQNAGTNEGEVREFQCPFPILAKTLWFAFGDGAPSYEGAKAA